MRRALAWSVRRELWENRSLYLAPVFVAAAMLGLSFVFAAMHLKDILARSPALEAQARSMIMRPYDGVAALLTMTCVIVAWFYCLDALHGERRDRSILFWKSLPVSDATAVAAKAIVPLAVMPAVAFVVIFVTQLVMLVASAIVLAAHGMGSGPLWEHVLAPRGWGVLLYGLLTLALWNAPVYAYLLAISAAVQRSPFLWAVLPPVALWVMEKVVLGTNAVGAFLQHRLFGSFEAAFIVPKALARPKKGEHAWPVPADPIADPARFFSSPAVWGGLVVALALLALAVWLRRRRDPI